MLKIISQNVVQNEWELRKNRGDFFAVLYYGNNGPAIYYHPKASMHAHVVDFFKLDPEMVLDGGFLVYGKYETFGSKGGWESDPEVLEANGIDLNNLQNVPIIGPNPKSEWNIDY